MITNDLSTLITQAKRNDTVAVTALIIALARDIRAFIASFVGTPAMLEEVHTATWLQVRREIAKCPDATLLLAWVREHAKNIILHRLKEESLAAISRKDSLSHLIIQDGLENLQALVTLHNDNAAHVRQKYNALDDNLQFIVHRRYADQVALDSIASEAKLSGPAEVAIRLFIARAQLYWRATTQDKQAPSDRLFPQAIEQFVANNLAAEAHQQLAQSVLKDISRAAAFIHQVRIDLILRSVFATYDEHNARSLAEAMAKIQPKRQSSDSSIVQVLPPVRSPAGNLHGSSRIEGRSDGRSERRNETRSESRISPQKPKSAPRPSDQRRKNASSGLRNTTSVVAATKKSIPLVVLIGGGCVLLGIILLFVVWSGDSASVNSTSPPRSEQGREIGTVLGFQRGYEIIVGDKRSVGSLGASLFAGNGLAVTNGEATLEINNRARVVVSAPSLIRAINRLDDKTSVIDLENGKLSIRNTSAPQLEIRSLSGRAQFGTARGEIIVRPNRMTVTSLEGIISLSNADGTNSFSVPAGATATVTPGTKPALVQARSFVRGINFTGNSVTINGNKWLTHRQALSAGLTLDAGISPALATALNTSQVDIDHKLMLENGITSAGKALSFSQTLPNHEYDVTLWITTNGEDIAKNMTILVNDKIMPFDGQLDMRAGWAKIGPLTTTITNQRMKITCDGLRRAYVAGVMWAAEKGETLSLLNAVNITSPIDGAVFSVNETFPVQAEIIGTTRSLDLYQEDRLLVKDLTAPYRAMIAIDKVGPTTITAKVVNTGAEPSVSVPLLVNIMASNSAQDATTNAVSNAPPLPLAAPGEITFYCWENITGIRSIEDALQHINFVGKPPSSSFTNAFFRLKDNWAEHILVRARGYIIAPQSGDYTFGVTGDNQTQFLLSTSEDPQGLRVIAYVEKPSGSGNYSSKPSQKSAPITLQQGARYYFEFRNVNNFGGGYGAVGWELPDKTLERPISAKHIISE
jgi:DNA-directed RNA polymerase specialized sigma24 family protein